MFRPTSLKRLHLKDSVTVLLKVKPTKWNGTVSD